jgi:hypothetical protein
MSFAIAIQLRQTFTTIDCCKCGVVFAVDESLNANWQREKTKFFCPNGHAQSYSENEADRLKRELIRVQADLDFQKRRAESFDKKLGRLKRRIKAGVCPCCQRTVSQLARHMATKHPEFAAAATVGS